MNFSTRSVGSMVFDKNSIEEMIVVNDGDYPIIYVSYDNHNEMENDEDSYDPFECED